MSNGVPVLQAILPVDDPEALRAILAGMADDDPELEKTYFLDDVELSAIVATFNVNFDAAQLDSKDLVISLFRWRPSCQARMSGLYPPMAFEGEDRFEHWVAKGALHREEVNEPLNKPVQASHGQTRLGHRTVLHAEGRRMAHPS